MITNVTLLAGQQIIINGSVFLPPTSITIIEIDPSNPTPAPLTINGAIVLGGSLTIVLADLPADRTLILIAAGSGNINGTFDTVMVTGPEGCKEVIGEQVISSGTLSVLLQVNNSGCKARAFLILSRQFYFIHDRWALVAI